MRTKVVDGKVYRMFEVSETAQCNEDYFKSDFEQIIRHYANILDVEEMKEFANHVIDSHF